MSESHDLGKQGEDLAAEHLKKTGYTIRHRNWKSGKTEIDIIAENKDFIVFAEVKTRSGDYLLDPAGSVNRDKQRTIIFAAEKYIQKFGVDKESRFDVIKIISKGSSTEIDHIENAFYPTLR